MADPLRILMVEDSPDDALLVLREIARAGFEAVPHRVDNRADFESALDRGSWDLVLADFSMPGFSGRAALDLLRARGLDTPFIFVSGTIGEENAVAAMKAGAGDYVMKDNLRRLLPAIERELREAADRRSRRSTEVTLRQTEERLAKVFSASPVAISISTLADGLYLDVNGAMQTLLARTREEIVGHTVRELDIWADPDQRNQVLRELREHGTIRNLDVGLRDKDGTVRRTLCNFERIDFGDTPCLLSVVADLTERVRLEEQLRQAQRLESIGRLAGGIAHDFNNLLTVILGSCELVRESASTPPELAAELERIRLAADSAASLTRQLLAFSRKQVLRPRRVDAAAIVARSESLLQRLLGKGIEVRVDLDRDATCTVVVDPGQLEQILLNLAVNSRDAMPSGGRLELAVRRIDLDEAAARALPGGRAGAYVRLRISDTGTGMPPEVLEHAFEPFFTTKEVGRGTGLGLATVHGIVAQSDGFIVVESEPGRGTSFSIHLPWVDGTPEDEPAARAAATEPAGGETILLVEDEAAVRRLVERMLAAKNYAVLVAPDGESALALARSHAGPIHLLLTDVVLPGLGGDALARELTALRPEIRVIFTSGYPSGQALGEGLARGRVAFLDKPFSPRELNDKLREVLDRA